MEIKFIDVLITVIFLILLAAPGFIFAKLKMLPEKAAETVSVIVLYCCQSVLVITSFQKKAFDPQIGLNMLWVALIALCVHFIMFAILKLVFIGKSADEKTRVLKFASVFSNCGFMGFPFLQSLFSHDAALLSEIMIYGAVIVAVFNLLTWTFGVYIMTGDKKQVSFKKIALNPVIISLIIGFILFVALPCPIVDLAADGSTLDSIFTKLMQSMNYLADMVTPCSMIVIGIRLANVNLKQLFLDKRAYISAFFKLIIMSLVAILAVAFLPVDVTVKYAIFFLLSMPSATNTAMFAVKFGGDGDFASVCVLLSTTLSVITIPLLYMVISGVFGINIG
ncbi:MAG: AEC family transporter [Christensenellaceae bacterium]